VLTVDDPANLNVSWTVTNQGTGAGRTGSWTDQVVLSTDGILGNGDDRVIGEFVHNGALAQGASYTQNQRILLPAA